VHSRKIQGFRYSVGHYPPPPPPKKSPEGPATRIANGVKCIQKKRYVRGNLKIKRMQICGNGGKIHAKNVPENECRYLQRGTGYICIYVTKSKRRPLGYKIATSVRKYKLVISS
jgi:hypothetical protein